MLSEWNYSENLEKARREGLISGEVASDPFRTFDFSLLEDGFSPANSRDLAGEMVPLLTLMKNEIGMYGELGGGTGKALSDVSILMKEMGTSHRLVNISTVPVDPYVLLNFSLKSRDRGEYQALLSRSGEELGSGEMKPDDLLGIQRRTSTEVVRQLDQPYIHDQRIGIFPQGVDLSGLGKQFLWLYDIMGAFHYSCHGTYKAKVYDAINKLVADNGVFLSMSSYMSKDEAEELHSRCEDDDVILFSGRDLLLMRKNSLALAYFTKEFPDLFKSGKVIFVPNFVEIMVEFKKKLELAAYGVDET